MADDKDRDTTLPVTGEVGSEGGSFADAATQVSTLEGDVRQVRATRGTPAEAAASGIVRYPTEPPHPPSATEGRRMGGMDWKTGLAGAAAGAAVALALSTLRRRQRP